MAWDDSDEFPAYDDFGDDGEAEEVPCPSCGAPVYEEADVCPHCGDFITPGRGPATRNLPRWAVALGVVGVIGTVIALLMH